MVKQEACTFSLLKIPAGKGKKYARTDGKIAYFLNKKCETHFKLKRNPRLFRWGAVYRRKREKQQKDTKKAKKIVVKSSVLTRGIAGITMDELLKKKNEKPEVRKAKQEAAIRALKAKKREVAEKNKVEKAQVKATQPKPAKKQQKIQNPQKPKQQGKSR
ncbi:large ribosomal subunit protein eL24-like [Symsagittifera roscoffensis]|uniref:large ribosomal subunit protein eL24-like n=1 Tax=Symsagittifera roscoffensis TaxID=84072 RepID=UPI00307B38A2